MTYSRRSGITTEPSPKMIDPGEIDVCEEADATGRMVYGAAEDYGDDKMVRKKATMTRMPLFQESRRGIEDAKGVI